MVKWIMLNRMIVSTVMVDTKGNALSDVVVISDKEITQPTDVSNFGYNRQEQLNMLEKIQQPFLEKQADFLK